MAEVTRSPYLQIIIFFSKHLSFLLFFSPFSLTWDHMGENSNDISSESTQQIHSPNPCILIGRVSTKVVQRIVNFGFLAFLALLVFTQ